MYIEVYLDLLRNLTFYSIYVTLYSFIKVIL